MVRDEAEHYCYFDRSAACGYGRESPARHCFGPDGGCLRDGNLVRVQGGARFGTSTLLSNGVLMTPILTGLAYNDVVVQGGFFPVGAFQGGNLLAQSDQGFMRGQGILALNFDFGNGMS